MEPSLFLSNTENSVLMSASVKPRVYSFIAFVNSEISNDLLLLSSKILNYFPMPIIPLAPLLANFAFTFMRISLPSPEAYKAAPTLGL